MKNLAGVIFDIPPAEPGGQWMYRHKLPIRGEAQFIEFLMNRMLPAMFKGYEAMVTDETDDSCALHVHGRKIIFPSREEFVEMVGADNPVLEMFEFASEKKEDVGNGN